MAYPLPLDPTPSSVEALLAQLPASARAELAWFPEEFRRRFVEPLRAARTDQLSARADELMVPALRLFVRLGRATATLFEDRTTADLLSPREPSQSGPLQERIEERVRPQHPGAADDLEDALAWVRAIASAIVADYRTQQSLGSVADATGAAEPNVSAELPAPVAFLFRGLLLTLSAAEVVLEEAPLPPTFELWCRMASREIQAAANALRAVGLTVPTAAFAPVFARWRPTAVLRPDPLPPGVLDTLLEALRPEEIWLFGSRARGTHGPDSDWDLLVVIPDDDDPDALEGHTVLGKLRRARIEVFPVRRADFEEARNVVGTLSHIAATQGVRVHGR